MIPLYVLELSLFDSIYDESVDELVFYPVCLFIVLLNASVSVSLSLSHLPSPLLCLHNCFKSVALLRPLDRPLLCQLPATRPIDDMEGGDL